MHYVTDWPIGEFTLGSSKLRVTDPCYDRETWCSGILTARPGKWSARIKVSDEKMWGLRNAELLVAHENYNPSENAVWVEQEFSVGVDSGQAGFFDDALYPDGETGEFDDKDTFYGKVCDITLDHKNGRAGVLAFGAVSSSGYGDGRYTCEAVYNGDEVVAARIIFIGEEEDEDEEE